ncbi:dnaJ domain-containing protein [Ditylenchus destructor]|uniref:DnaJ domain-containing protein n=1 Tax=Ditylenchus destructor TaxID=166010 RepID=A0AAD4RCK0_9BILA|nr:dnaJ domain-containing protein [Ditylenchus destructor]
MPDRTRRESSSKRKNLYDILEIEKAATDDDIKRAYRKLALKYHPDKNLEGDQTKTERFKEINYANAILSNPEKRKIYDEYGEVGLKMMEQLGEERMIFFSKPWLKWVVCSIFVLTCGCFGCFCCCFCGFQCCCNFCCGKFKPKEFDVDHFDDIPHMNGGNETDAGVQQPSDNSQTQPIVLGPPPSSTPSPNYGSTQI